MKYIIFFFSILFWIPLVQASDRDLFTYDHVAVNRAVFDLSRLERILDNHPEVTTVDLLQNGKFDSNTMDQLNNPAGLSSEPPLGIPSFLWGCVFGVVGMVIVLIMTDKDKDELKKALYGCIVSYLIVGVLYFFILISYSAVP